MSTSGPVDAVLIDVDRYRLMLALAREVTAELDLQKVLAASLEALQRFVRFGGGSIQLIDDRALRLAATEPPATAEALAMRIPLGQGVGGRIAVTGDARYIPDVLADLDVEDERRRKASSGQVRSYFGVPLVGGGEVIGILQLDSEEVDAFSPADQLAVLSFSPLVAAAVQNAQVHRAEQEARERFESLEAQQRDFVALVSHELRGPMSNLVGFTEALLGGTSVDPGAADMLRACHRAAKRLQGLVLDLLDLSVIEGAALPLQPGPTTLAQLAADVIDQFVPAGRRAEVRITPAGAATVVDHDRVVQVAGNLVANAAAHSPVDSDVELELTAEDESLVISVLDRGPGIPVADRGRIFERFVRLDSTAAEPARDGFGVGLYVVARLCQRMAAEVEVHERPGGGSNFTVRIPVPGQGAQPVEP